MSVICRDAAAGPEPGGSPGAAPATVITSVLPQEGAPMPG
jgi:hypothetical protein